MGSAQPSTGTDWLIVSFAVSIIGGTALSGGEFSALGIFASAIMLTLIKNGLIMLNVNVYFEQTFLGHHHPARRLGGKHPHVAAATVPRRTPGRSAAEAA